MGEMTVPAHVLYGATTQRAVLNFPVSGRPVPPEVIRAFALLKRACAEVELRAEEARPEAAAASSCDACDVDHRRAGRTAEYARRRCMEHFPIDVFQTGSGTSTNMNVNEVISNLACRSGRRPIGSRRIRSTRTTTSTWASPPTTRSRPRCRSPRPWRSRAPGPGTRARSPQRSSARHGSGTTIVKIGRTHLMDATPIRLGQEFSGYAAQARVRRAPCGAGDGAPGGESARSAAPPSAPASTPTRASGAWWPAPLGQRPASTFGEADEPLRGPGDPRLRRRGLGRAEDDRGEPHEDRQRHPLARLRPALRPLRAEPARDAAGLVDHAGQGESGDLRIA